MADAPYNIITDLFELAGSDGLDADDRPDLRGQWPPLGALARFTPRAREMTFADTGRRRGIDDVLGYYDQNGVLRRYALDDGNGGVTYGPAGVSLDDLTSDVWVSPIDADKASWTVSFENFNLPDSREKFTPRTGSIRPGYEGETRLGVLLPQTVVNGVPVVRGEPGKSVVNARNDGPDAAVFLLEGGGETDPVELPVGPQGSPGVNALGAEQSAVTVGQYLAAPTPARAAAVEVADATAALPGHKLASGDEPRGVVSWTYDDGYSSIVDYFGLLNARNIKGTLFLTKNWVGMAGTNPSWGDTYPTQAQVQAVAAAGHELGTHGLNHESVVNYRTSNGDAALAALYDSLVDYIEQTYTGPGGTPVKVTTGAYPAGASDRRCREIMGRRHLFFRGTRGVVAKGGFHPYDVPAIDVQTVAEATIKARIDEAKAADSLVVFLIHGRGPGATRDAEMTKLAACMDYATSVGVRQIPFGQAMAERTQRRSPGAMVDTSGNAFNRELRSFRSSVVRDDLIAGEVWHAIDLVSNAPYFDTDTGQKIEVRGSGLSVLGTRLEVGRQRDFSGTTTAGSPAVSLTGLSVNAAVIGIGVSGTNIPAGAFVGSYSAGIVNLVDSAGVALPATTSGTGTVTLAWPTPPVSQFFGRAEFHGTNPRAYGAAASNGYDIWSLDGALLGRLSAGGFSRSSSGPVAVSATNGNIELKGSRTKNLTAAGTAFLSDNEVQPADSGIANGEVVRYRIPTAGAAKLAYRGKEADGTVRQVFMNLTPVALAAAATDAASVQTLVNDIRAKLVATGQYS